MEKEEKLMPGKPAGHPDRLGAGWEKKGGGEKAELIPELRLTLSGWVPLPDWLRRRE